MAGPRHALAGPGTEPSRAAIFSDDLPGFNQTLAREIGGQVRAAGYAVETIDTTVLTNQALLVARSGIFDLKEVERWSKHEGHLEKLREFLEEFAKR